MKIHSFTSSSEKGRGLIRLACFMTALLVLSGLVAGLSYFYSSKNGPIHRQRFYEQKEDIDVLFVGTSHAYAGYLPMELYRKYGISAFNLSTAGERFAVTYYSLLDALEYHQPKVLVIDCHAFEYGDEKNDKQVPTRCHGVFDGMKMSRIKIDAVKDVLDDNKASWPEYFFPLYYYHNRWSELKQQDFEDPVLNNYGKGGRLFYGVANVAAPETIPETDYIWEDNYSTEYAEKIVKLCKEKGIDVHFMCIPFPCTIETQRVLNQAQYLSEKYDNCSYVNLMNHVDEMGFDYASDMADAGSHVNPSGGRKVTDYIGEYLLKQYDFKDYRSDDANSVWNKDYRYFTTYYDTLRGKCENYLEYLSMVWSEDYSLSVYITDVAAANKDELLYKLLSQNLNVEGMKEAEHSYYCSNMNESAIEELDIPIEETDFPEEYRSIINDDTLVAIVLRNNQTGAIAGVTGWGELTASENADRE